MVAFLADKSTAKDAWDSIAATRVGLNRARKATVQKLRQEWDRLVFQPKEDINDFALRLSSLVRQLARHGNSDIDEQKTVEKYLCIVPKKYTQIALSMETLLDLSTMSIEEVTGRLKAVDDHEEVPLANPISANGKLLFTEEQWLARQKEKKKQEGSSSSKDRRRQPRRKSSDGGTGDGGDGKGGGGGGGGEEHKATRDDTCLNCGRHGHWAKDCRQPRRQGAAHMAQAKEEESSLFLTHASPVLQPKGEASKGEALASLHTHSTPPLTSSALLHNDEPRATGFLDDDSDDDKLEGWYLDSGATHHMTGCIGHFADLDCNVRGFIKFGDKSTVEICGIGSIVFVGKTDEHKLLPGVYYIPALRNSIISLGQLDEGGLRVEIDRGVL
jgi:hypothetical protein